ncbi:HupE/UreJ family protein [Methylomonas sp. AM2-LC]|uniref:HupE/UreJ family protein n=1 Tax=Methylomonas sp. AM2-LC TaxID=3153301 RepID=UPI00326786E1
MRFFSRKQSDSRYSLFRLVFSFGLPLVLIIAFLGKSFINVNDIGLANGFSHPLTGWDHLVTMLAVGIWAAQLRGRAVWMLPLAFVSVMSLGGLAGASGVDIPNVDGIILVSCAVFSVLITRNIRFSSKINVLIVAFFAFFHGFAHGQEISTSASLLSYIAGFMLATLLLHGAGILVAKLVVLAVTCLLTVLFSSSALAKTAESVININDNNPVVHQFQNQVNPANASFDSPHVLSEQFARQDAGGGVLSSLTTQLSGLLSAQQNQQSQLQQLQQQKLNSAADYQLFAVKHSFINTGVVSITQRFYPSDSADCQNLDFKNYFPKINHTPGKHLLSNGVGLTSPPAWFYAFLVPRPFQNTCFYLTEAANLQCCFARFPSGNTVNKSHRRLNYPQLRFVKRITVQPWVARKGNADNYKSQNSFATSTNNPSLFQIAKMALLAEWLSADTPFFLSKPKSYQLDGFNKIII